MLNKEPKKGFLLLDAFRGLAAIWVVLYHGRLESIVEQFPSIAHSSFYGFCSVGMFGVQLFFVISGYCIANAAAACLRRGTGALPFMWARIHRIYPPYFFAILASVCMALLAGWLVSHGILRSSKMGDVKLFGQSAVWYFSQLTLTQMSFHQDRLLDVSWTLNYEIAFYLIVAIALWCAARTTTPRRWLATSLHLVTIVSMGIMAFKPSWKIFPFDAWPQFGMGILVFDFLSSERRIKELSVFTAILAIELIAFLWPLDFGRSSWHEGAPDIFALAAGFSVLLILIHPIDARLSALRPTRFIAWIGTFSYSLYLTHVMTSGVVTQICRSMAKSPARLLGVYAAEMIVSILAAYVFFLLCERPFLSRRQVKRDELVTAPPAAPSMDEQVIPVPA